MKNKKLIALIMCLVLMLSMTFVLVACSKDEADEMADPSELVEISSDELADMIVSGLLKALSAQDSKYIGMDMNASYEWSDGDQKVVYDFVGQMTLDLDTDKSSISRDNQIKIELNQTINGESKTVLGIYYKERLGTSEEAPKLYVRVGDTKLAIEFMSVKKFLQDNQIEIVGSDLGDGNSIKEVLSVVLLLFCKDLKANGEGSQAQATFDLQKLITFIGDMMSDYNLEGEIDSALADAGLDLTVEDIMAITTEIDVELNFGFRYMELVKVEVDIDVKRDHEIVVDMVDGSSLIDIIVPRGTVKITIDELRFLNYEVDVEMPKDIDEFQVIGLINVDIEGQANFYKADGSVNNGGKNNLPIDFFVRADFNPFIILDGITESNVHKLGMLHIKAKGEGKPFLEVVFDPINTGTNYLYVYIQTMGGIGQNLTFDLPATISFLTNTAKALADQEGGGGSILDVILSQIKGEIVDREGQKNLMLTIQLGMLREEIDKLMPGGVDLGPLGVLTLGNMILGKDNTYATMEFTKFSYGTIRRGEYDATASMDKGSSSIIKEVTGIKGAKTEYKLGEAFQYQVNSDVKVDTIMLNGKKPFLALSAKVIKVEGYDPNQLGEQTVTVTMRDNGLIASIIAGAVGGDQALPLGVFTFTYKINVTE